MRTLQEWMGNRDLATHPDLRRLSPSGKEAEMIARAFERGRDLQDAVGERGHSEQPT
jgi:hypothetical protein